jgi:hypothetical protein
MTVVPLGALSRRATSASELDRAATRNGLPLFDQTGSGYTGTTTTSIWPSADSSFFIRI